MRKILFGVCIVLITICAIGCSKTKKPDFQALYDEYCLSIYAEVGDDNSYLMIDTVPDNDGTKHWSSLAYKAVLNINEALGLPESLTKSIESTTALMGLQEETYENLGIKVSWTYHPDNGLEILYTME